MRGCERVGRQYARLRERERERERGKARVVAVCLSVFVLSVRIYNELERPTVVGTARSPGYLHYTYSSTSARAPASRGLLSSQLLN